MEKPVALNDQNQVVGVTGTNGYLWTSGSTSSICSLVQPGQVQKISQLLPAAYRNQVVNINPIDISGSNAVDGSVRISFGAQYQTTSEAGPPPADQVSTSPGWSSGIFLLTLESGTQTALEQIETPPNASASLGAGILNSQGLIANTGTLSTTGTGSMQKAVLLVPVQINEVTSQNPAPGRPLTSASAAIVGEPITLSISGTNIIPGYNFITAYKWHVPNAIKNYNPFASGTAVNDPPVIQLQTSDLNASTTGTLYYPVVPQNSSSGSIATSGTESVSCDLTLSTGGTCTVIAPLRIVAPSVQITGSMPGPLNLSNTTSGTTAIGTFIDGGNSVLFTTEPSGVVTRSPGVTPPTGFTSGSAGWLQVLSDNVNATASGSHTNVLNQVNYNDHGFPYPGGQMQWILSGNSSDSSYDSPSWPADYPPQTELDRTFSAGMYYMWISNVPKSIWVPLGVIGWGFKGQIDWSPNEQQFDWGGTPSKSPIVNIMPPQEPSWANTSHL